MRNAPPACERVVTNEPTTAADLAALAEDRRPFLVDVREDDEWAAGSIPGARHIALGELVARADEIPRDCRVVLYCRAGTRSAHAVAALARLGYDNVHNLEGGIEAWRAQEPGH